MNDKDLVRDVVTYLENYVSDLKFQLSHGSDFVNSCTNETPEFKNDHEAKSYVSEINSLLDKLRPDRKFTIGLSLDIVLPVEVIAKTAWEAEKKAIEKFDNEDIGLPTEAGRCFYGSDLRESEHRVFEVEDIEEDSK